MGRTAAAVMKAYCAHGYPSYLCNRCAIQSACIHGMVRDCLLCNKQGLDSWYGRATTGTATGASALAAAASLRLGINEKYRSAILLAAQRTGLDPAGIAAVINAEAAPLADRAKKEKLVDEAFRGAYPHRDWDKKPLDARAPADVPLIKAWKALYTSTAWDERSRNNESGAAGLTQFVAGTWRTEATRKETYLYKSATESGYVDTKGKLISSRDGELLELRYNPTLSIVAAAEYDKYALDQLSKKKLKDTTEVDKIFFAKHPERDFKKQTLNKVKDSSLIQEWNQLLAVQPGKSLVPDDLTSDQKARYLYLCHHEGPDGACQILDGSLTDDRAKYLFSFNVTNQKQLNDLVSKHGSYRQAYVGWIWSYIDQRIQPSGFRA